MELIVAKLLVDFGLVVLIWIVQLIIYPGFTYYQKQSLVNWHQLYTFRIGVIVMPLMIGQLTISFVQVFSKIDFHNILNLILIIAVWISTFLQFVPIHNRITNGKIDMKLMNTLIKINWLRTFLWTMIFSLTLYTYYL